MTILRKDIITELIYGTQAVDAVAAIPYVAGHWVAYTYSKWVLKEIYNDPTTVTVLCDSPPLYLEISRGSCYQAYVIDSGGVKVGVPVVDVVVSTLGTTYGWGHELVTESYWVPEQEYVPATQAQPPTASELSVSMNEGWNSWSESSQVLTVGDYISFNVANGITGLALCIGTETESLVKNINVYSHGLIIDTSGINVFENGEIVTSLKGIATSDSEIRIYRNTDNTITYSVIAGDETVSYDSLNSLDFAGIPLIINAFLYYGGDSILDANVVSGGIVYGEATLSGTSELSVYAGQTVILSAGSSLTTVNYDALLSGSSSLTAKSSVIGSVYMAGTSSLYVTPSLITGGGGFLPALESSGFEAGIVFGSGSGDLQPLTSEGSGGFYVPSAPIIGIASLPVLISSGTITKVAKGDGSGELPELTSIGGISGYAIGNGELQPLHSSALFGFANTVSFFSGLVGVPLGIIPKKEVIVVFNSSGVLVDTITGSKEYIAELLSSINGSSIFTLLGSFSDEIISSIIGDSTTISQKISDGGTSPSLNDTSRVWVVNMDTAASSQYENYGFNHFFNKDNVSHGIADDGIYRLDGDDDSGVDISSLMDMGRSDYGITNPKKLLRVYVGVGSDEKIYLKAETDSVTRVYEANTSSQDIRDHRVDISRTQFGHFWNLTLMNQNGSDFVLSTVDFQPLKLNRRMR